MPDLPQSGDASLAVLLTTHNDTAGAEALARLLIDSRAAACVNLLPNVTSIYRWEGRTEKAREIIMLIKSNAQKVPEVVAILEAHHSYDVPEIIRLDADVLHEPYMEWVRDCLAL